MTETKNLTEDELKQVSGGTNVNNNDSIVWKFSKDQVFYGHGLTSIGTRTWTVRVTIIRCFEKEGEPWYEVCFYDQMNGNRNAEKSEAYLTGKTGQFELE